MGNFSRDSFTLTNLLHSVVGGEIVANPRPIVAVRMQQGVPVLDADWNELEDIRRLEQQLLGMSFLGNGVPAGSEGFRVLGGAPANDFFIEAGLLLASGWPAINTARTTYLTQSNAATQLQTPPLPSLPALPALAPPGVGEGTRFDLVFLDVWEREVTAEEDGRLRDTRIGIDTAVRLQREWVVRVVEDVGDGAVAVPLVVSDALPGHRVYSLARLRRPEAKTAIDFDDITELRRTDLTLSVGESPLRVYSMNGVLQYDRAAYATMCESALDAYADLLGSDLFLNHNFDTATTIESMTLLDVFQDVKAECRTGGALARSRDFGVAAALAFLDRLERAQHRFHDALKPLADSDTGRVMTSLFLDQLNVLLGEATPQLSRGLRQALDDSAVREAIDAQLAINAFVGSRTGTLPQGRVTVSLDATPPGGTPITAPGVYRYRYVVGSEVNAQETFDLSARVDGATDWTTSLPATVELAPNTSSPINVDVTIPALTGSTAGNLVVRARSHRNPVVDESNTDAVITLNAPPPPPVPLRLHLVAPGINVDEDVLPVGRTLPAQEAPRAVRISVRVLNDSTSSSSQTFTVQFSFSVANVFEPLTDQSVSIVGNGAFADVQPVLRATDTSAEGTQADLTITATRQDDSTVTKTLTIMLRVQKT